MGWPSNDGNLNSWTSLFSSWYRSTVKIIPRCHSTRLPRSHLHTRKNWPMLHCQISGVYSKDNVSSRKLSAVFGQICTCKVLWKRGTFLPSFECFWQTIWTERGFEGIKKSKLHVMNFYMHLRIPRKSIHSRLRLFGATSFKLRVNKMWRELQPSDFVREDIITRIVKKQQLFCSCQNCGCTLSYCFIIGSS